ncbi:receptor-like protein EIX2 [Dioscorea cayenensis subsp. rotundata]|uniref:Receptor-like protein EIX2 n=1 Tax=Dioscorea cayennensis subsp. rotundata TaxID=55577 RepID=A0AB40C697_DIOCR|nr:receptor-like protein EIX2 [Dioscorea cayenensis subsp. rotundata]
MALSMKKIKLLHFLTFVLHLWLELTCSCIETEKQALLKFKNSLKDPGKLLSSWTGDDCCSWKGLACNNQTGNIISLDISYGHIHSGPNNEWQLGGKIDASLVELKHLSYLDLSSNDFGGSQIPDFIGSITTLSYLNLSNAGFHGEIPSQLGNLTNLRWCPLDVFSFWFARTPASLPSVSNFTSLATIVLDGNQINATFPSWIFNISSLKNVYLRFNSFHGVIPDTFEQLVSLEALELGGNSFSGIIPGSMRSLCSLHTLGLFTNKIEGETTALAEILSGCVSESIQVLNLRGNKFRGDLSDWIGTLRRITMIDLSKNLLYGSIPAALGKLSTLTYLYLNHNEFNGSLPESIRELSQLQVFDMSFNQIEGVVSEAHFANLTSLKQLSMASNSLTLNMSSEWIPPFKLEVFSFRSCMLGPKFPAWLRTQRNYSLMDLSSTGISDTMPDWFWTLTGHIVILDLSDNLITGIVPSSLKFIIINVINLSSNRFYGALPPFSSNIEYIDFSNNLFSGTLLPITSEYLPLLGELHLSNNLINGTILASICNFAGMQVIDLSSNRLFGQVPACFPDLVALMVINLENNNLSGEIPDNLDSFSLLQALHLGDNSISGRIPTSLRACKSLLIIDLGGNKLSGNIPSWIGEALPSLRILRLRANMFEGHIPEKLSYLTALQILDLGDNNLSGTIPESFGNFSAMVEIHKERKNILDSVLGAAFSSIGNYVPLGYTESLQVITKGMEMEYTKNLQFVTSMDLSDNQISGHIPAGLGKLSGLQSLNLSGNHLSGNIPVDIGNLRFLESLDLSRNELSGAIPTSMSAMTSLSHLNLSYNNLSGKIPSGYQLQTINEQSMYIGNDNLCGPPLKVECDSAKNQTEEGSMMSCGDGEEDCESEKLWWYIGSVLGYIVGFWAVCGTLLYSESLRNAYFHFLEKLGVTIGMKRRNKNDDSIEEHDQ